MSHIKGCLFFLLLFLGGFFSSFVQAEKKLEERVLFLGLPTGIFTSIDFIKKENKVLIVDKSTTLDPHQQEELSQYDEVIPVDDYYNSGEVILAALKSFADKPYSTLVALSESDILRAGALRDYLHIKGQSLSSAEAFRNKVVMKDTLEKNGIKTAPFAPLKTELDLIRFIELNGYPVIIKPRKAYGAIETYVLKSKDDLEAILKTKNVFDEFQNEKFFVESFIDGDMYHVDGLIYKVSSPRK
jgi:biotin carboxylase